MLNIDGDLVTSPIQIIAQQVNCKGVMGAGLAKQLRLRYRELYVSYKDYIEGQVDGPPLGRTMVYYSWEHGTVLDGDLRIILNIFGQDGYGRDRRYTDYEAVEDGFYDGIRQLRDDMGIDYYIQLTIGIPYGFGCGLGGGDWTEITKILERVEQQMNVLFVVYKYC